MAQQISSPLVSAANNIVSLGSSSKRSLVKVQKDFNDFVRFLEVENKNIEKTKIPKKEKIKNLSSINLANSFGNSGNLLSNLINGSFDVSQFLGNMFPVKGRQGKPQSTSGIKSQKPLSIGNKLKFTGIRSLGIVNSIFAGLDFATGLQEGESIGKAAAGSAGSLAGSLLGGAIGQALIPIPGIGFVLGSMAGGFLGGWGADRATELATGGAGGVSGKLQERLKRQEEAQKSAVEKGPFQDIISKFDSSVSKFEEFVYTSFASMINAAATATGEKEMMMDYALDPEVVPDTPSIPGQMEEMTAEGGELPSRNVSSPYGWRWGRLHAGVDYPRPLGTPVSVIQPGQVSYAGSLDGYGNTVIVSHPGGYSTLYGHLDSISVGNGQQIEPGTVIGNTGSTGRSTGPHVHFEVRQGDKRLQIPNNEGDKYFRFGGNVKVKPKASKTSGKPTAVLMAGTNDYANPKSGVDGVKKSIKALQDKGYNVVVVPPSEQGQTSIVSKAIQQVASEMGATIRKGQYKPTDNSGAIPYAHLTDASAGEIANQYKGATFVGDSNAQLMPNSFIAGPGFKASKIAKEIETNVPMASVKPAIGGPDLTPEMVELYKTGAINQYSSYPMYNQSQSSVTIMPMYLGGGQGQTQQTPIFIPSAGGGGETVILPGPTRSDMVNNLMKTMLLTNLSGT